MSDLFVDLSFRIVTLEVIDGDLWCFGDDGEEQIIYPHDLELLGWRQDTSNPTTLHERKP